MPGLAPISLQQFLNPTTGLPYSGARAGFFEASSGTPIVVYQDYGLGTPHSNPVIADAYGRFPPIFISEAVGFYRLRLTTSGGVVLPLGDGGSFDIDVLPVIGPVEGDGGGAEVPVDPNSVLTTGDVIWTPAKTTRAGFVRMNGRTIGSGSSGAAERANADCEDLYTYIHNNFSDTLCPVTGGRGANAAADFAANKPIATIDMRARGPFGLDDMGNSAASRLSGLTFGSGGTATTGGANGGASTKTLITSEMPSHTHVQTAQSPTFTYTERNDGSFSGSSDVITELAATGLANSITTTGDASPGDTGVAGSGAAFDKMPPFILGTWLWRL